MKRYDDLVAEALARVKEVTPWDFGRRYQTGDVPLLLDIREPTEFAALRIPPAPSTCRAASWSSHANGITTKPCRSWQRDASVKSW